MSHAPSDTIPSVVAEEELGSTLPKSSSARRLHMVLQSDSDASASQQRSGLGSAGDPNDSSVSGKIPRRKQALDELKDPLLEAEPQTLTELVETLGPLGDSDPDYYLSHLQLIKVCKLLYHKLNI